MQDKLVSRAHGASAFFYLVQLFPSLFSILRSIPHLLHFNR